MDEPKKLYFPIAILLLAIFVAMFFLLGRKSENHPEPTPMTLETPTPYATPMVSPDCGIGGKFCNKD